LLSVNVMHDHDVWMVHSGENVPVQPELENERSPLVKDSAPSGRGFSRHEEIYRMR